MLVHQPLPVANRSDAGVPGLEPVEQTVVPTEREATILEPFGQAQQELLLLPALAGGAVVRDTSADDIDLVHQVVTQRRLGQRSELVALIGRRRTGCLEAERTRCRQP